MKQNKRPDPDATIRTRVAHAGWSDHRHYGFSVFADLVGKETFTGLVILAVTGRRIPPEECRILDDISGILTLPEPRIHPMKATRVLASYGRFLPACVGATLCAEGGVLGPWTSVEVAKLLLSLSERDGDAESRRNEIRRIASETRSLKRRLPGFGVPFRERDERLEKLRECVATRGLNRRRFWKLQEELSKVVHDEIEVRPNVSIGVAAVCLDLGLSAEQIPAVFIVMNQNVFLANAVEGAKQAPEILRRLPDNFIAYEGPEPRTSTRMMLAEGASCTQRDE